MLLNAEIKSDKQLYITVDTECASITVERIDIYNQNTFEAEPLISMDLSDISQYRNRYKLFNTTSIHDYVHIVFDEFGLYNASNNANILQDLIIVKVQLRYTSEYSNCHSCSEQPQYVYFATYYKCNLYDRIVANIKQIKDPQSDCEDVSTQKITNELLRKKIIDLCIETQNLSLACMYWNKFYFNKNSYNVQTKKNCGCHG